jgi:hypothetical protein
MKKHLVYAEDLLWEIMQYPSHNISKGLIRSCTEKIIKEKQVSLWQYIRDSFIRRFSKDA